MAATNKLVRHARTLLRPLHQKCSAPLALAPQLLLPSSASWAQRRGSQSTVLEQNRMTFGANIDTGTVFKLITYSNMNPSSISIQDLMDHGRANSPG